MLVAPIGCCTAAKTPSTGMSDSQSKEKAVDIADCFIGDVIFNAETGIWYRERELPIFSCVLNIIEHLIFTGDAGDGIDLSIFRDGDGDGCGQWRVGG